MTRAKTILTGHNRGVYQIRLQAREEQLIDADKVASRRCSANRGNEAQK